jgi:hypothetical protein
MESKTTRALVSKRLRASSVSSSPTNELAGLAELWAKRYVDGLGSPESSLNSLSLESVDSPSKRRQTVEKLSNTLKYFTATAWSKTEQLLTGQVLRHRIDLALIDPWEIAQDTYSVYEEMFADYQDGSSANRLTTSVGPQISRMRKKYTAHDPRILGFVSMQFHYSGQILLTQLSQEEQQLVSTYLKVLDDHLYMPLQRAYEAAGTYSSVSPVIAAVEHLIAKSTEIAQEVYKKVLEAFPTHQCLTGLFSSQSVAISATRDIEMFLIYLCLCSLEKDITLLQEELFPLCIMLYPALKVDWNMIRLMFNLIRRQIQSRLRSADVCVLLPSLDAMSAMFSPQVLSFV